MKRLDGDDDGIFEGCVVVGREINGILAGYVKGTFDGINCVGIAVCGEDGTCVGFEGIVVGQFEGFEGFRVGSDDGRRVGVEEGFAEGGVELKTFVSLTIISSLQAKLFVERD
eukprot:gene17321-23910_t